MKRRFKVITTTSNHKLPISPNYVNRDFYSNTVDKIYVGDITYIPTKEGWLYLTVVIDVYSRKVVGWSMSHSLHTSLVNDALIMAIKRRVPAKGLIYHTDRGSQYASYEHKSILEKYGIIQSMSKKGTKINKDTVALEAGRKRGSIKKSRIVFKELLDAIDKAQEEHTLPIEKLKLEKSKFKNDAKDYKKKYEDGLKRELMLIEKINELEKELRKLNS